MAELEARSFDIELIADELYRANVTTGSSFVLADTLDENGTAFSGIDDGTWLLALTCGTCMNPAPWFITSLRDVHSSMSLLNRTRTIRPW